MPRPLFSGDGPGTIGDVPGVFRQKRPGLHGDPFYMYKFRTMTNACDDNSCLLPDCDRMTSLGRFLRATSLDELPELLMGEFKGSVNG